MKKTLILTASILGAAAVLDILFGEIGRQAETPTIYVNGECLTTAPKDRTAITLRVTTVDKNAATSMKKATDKMAQITNFLKNKNVKMQTTEFDSYEKSEWDYNLKKNVKIGIETRISVEVSSEDVSQIEDVLNQFAGDQNVYLDNFHMFTSSETMKPIIEKCMGTALENARARANASLAPDKKRAGKLLSASYGNSSYADIPTVSFRSAKLASFDEASIASIDTGGSFVSKDTNVTVSVSAAFEIK